MEDNLSIEYIHKDFSNLSKLGEIYDEMMGIAEDLSRSNNLLSSIDRKQDLKELLVEGHEKKSGSGLFGGNDNSGEIIRLQKDNLLLNQQLDEIKKEDSRLKKQLEDLQGQIIKLIDIQSRKEPYTPPTITHPNNLSGNQSDISKEEVKSDSPQPKEDIDVIPEHEFEKPETNIEDENNSEKVDKPKKKGVSRFFSFFKREQIENG